jgi:hypothetical protein
MYDWFNRELWDKCFSLIDPKLRDQAKVELPGYASSMQEFKAVYGAIRPWYTRISFRLDASPSQRDKRPFAYVYVIWQDERHGFHLFRERWVKDSGRWFTRVVGLVRNQQESAYRQD